MTTTEIGWCQLNFVTAYAHVMGWLLSYTAAGETLSPSS